MTATDSRRRRFVDGYDERQDAAAVAFRLAPVLVRARLAGRFGVSVHRIPVSRSSQGWGVYLTDREPDQDPPAVISFSALARPESHHRAA
ncbi:hypothetical protein OG413_19930 [Streptomyces sp. NBC_01433]|uniref:hypothetical protein n=1 Tax=Streptomyces sp. NBC_01433 TaxID=2903864 RepID=UPI002250A3F4|nr:hypothetical protein [Streptomyces sp. NBC_01433]MCX4677544.1 hypothetical protein [Streptomyces sp. NBC_01433]